jgi:hypothetical protein
MKCYSGKIHDIFNLSGGDDKGLNTGDTVVFYLGPGGWNDQTELQICQLMQHYLSAANVDLQILSPTSVRDADAAVDVEIEHSTPLNFMECMLLPGLGAGAKRFAHAQSSTDLARTAIALERYRLAHGEFPESLDALAPHFMEKIPHDIINGQPLHYRRTDDGQFVLYSVGWNEADDGGMVVMTEGSSPHVDLNKGDWIWRYPAK